MADQKVKELKDDIILKIQVNKTFYQMSKAALFVAFKQVFNESSNPDEFVKSLVAKDYIDMTDQERLFYTLTLLVGEIENEAAASDGLVEKTLTINDIKNELDGKVNGDILTPNLD